MIGTDWLNSSQAESRGIDDPEDPVRIELSAAFANGIPLLPVLVNGAKMPSAEQLPTELEELSYRNAVTVRSGRDFQFQIEHLIGDLTSLLGTPRLS